MGWTTGGSIPDGASEGIFLLATTSRPALRPAQPPVQWVPEDLSFRVMLTTHFHLVTIIRGAIPPLPHYVFTAWCLVLTQGQLYILPRNSPFASLNKMELLGNTTCRWKLIRGVKLTIRLRLVARSKNGWSCTSTAPIRHHGVLG
jgi:hypothetical protein